jgi:GGDEF domain-containing protein
MKDNSIITEALSRGYTLDEIADKLSATQGLDPTEIRGRGYSSDEILEKLGYSQVTHAVEEEKSRSVGDVAGDVVVTAAKSAIGLPQSLVGIADIPTGGRVGQALEDVGVRFDDAQQDLSGMYSDAQQAANRKVQEADGFVDTTRAAIQNPSVIATTAGESLAQILGGAAVAKGLIKTAPKVAPWLAGAIGEGAIGAGSAEEQIRAQSEDGLTTVGQSLSALGSGIGTAALGAAGGKLAQKFKFADVDTILAQGGANAVAAGEAKKGFIRQVTESGISEGVFEELPQSVQEQMWQNFATDKPLTEGVGNAAALGMLTGAVMGGAGGGFNAASQRKATPTTPTDILATDTADEAIQAFTETVSSDIPAEELLTGLDDTVMPKVQLDAIPSATQQQPDLRGGILAESEIRSATGTGGGNVLEPVRPTVVGDELATGQAQRTGDAAGVDAQLLSGTGSAAVGRRTNLDLRQQYDAMPPDERSAALDALHKKAYVSDLTGLQNKRAFDEHVTANPQAKVLYGDVDGLKALNTRYGHNGADQILKAVGEVKAAVANELGVNAFHRSGDEFLAVHSDPDILSAYGAEVQKRLDSATVEVTLPDGSIERHTGIGLSFGVGENDKIAETRANTQKAERKGNAGAVPVQAAAGNEDQQSSAQVTFGTNSAGRITLRGVPSDKIKSVRDKLNLKGVIIGADNAVFPKGTNLETLKAELGIVAEKPQQKAKPKPISADERARRAPILSKAKSLEIKIVARPFSEIEKDVLSAAEKEHADEVSGLTDEEYSLLDDTATELMERLVGGDEKAQAELQNTIQDLQKKYSGREYYEALTNHIEGLINEQAKPAETKQEQTVRSESGAGNNQEAGRTTEQSAKQEVAESSTAQDGNVKQEAEKRKSYDKLRALKAQAQGKISGDQGAALKELADAGEHAAVDEVLKPKTKGKFERDNAYAKNDAERELDAAAHTEYLPGDVMIYSTGKYAPFDLAVSLARDGIESGAFKANEGQIHLQLGIAPRDTDRVLDAALKPAKTNKPADVAKEQKSIDNTGGIMFSKAKGGEPTLIIQHNLTEQNLLHADRMGGIPIPSLAITQAEHPLENFGEITLVGGIDMADPKGYAATKVFGADIYSPRYPSITHQVTSKVMEVFNRKFGDMQKLTGARPIYPDDISSDGERTIAENGAVMAYFLEGKGITPKIVLEDAPKLDKELMPFKDDNRTEFELAKDDAFQDAAIKNNDRVMQSLYPDGVEESDKLDRTKDGFGKKMLSYARDITRYQREMRDAGKPNEYRTKNALRAQIDKSNLGDEYSDYAKSVLDSLNPEEKIFQGYTYNGNRKYIPHTLDNVIKLLKKELRGGENFNYDVGTIRSKFTPQFKSIAQIRAAKDRLMDADKFAEVKSEIDNDFFALAEEFSSYHPIGGKIGFGDTMSSTLYDAATMGLPRAFRENGFETVPAEKLKDAAEFLDKLRTLPTEYFEAKILRAVDLSEFKGAVVPEGTSQKALDVLKARGITNVLTYSTKDANDRAAKIKQLAQQADLLFSRGGSTTNETPFTIAQALRDNPNTSKFTDILLKRGNEGKKGGIVIAKDIESLPDLFKEKTGVELGEDVLQSIARDDYFKRADQIERALNSMGLRTEQEKSRQSLSTYIYAYAPDGSDFKENEGEYLKIRVSDHKLPDSYVEPDFEVMLGEGHDGSLMNNYGTWDEAVEFVAKQFNMDVPPVIKRLDSLAKTQAVKAENKAKEYRAKEAQRKLDVAKNGTYSKAASGNWWLNKDSGLMSSIAQIGKMPEMNAEQVKAAYIKKLEKELTIAESEIGSAQSNPDIHYSKDGKVQALYDPKSGLTFMVANHLTKETAAPVVMHEIGVHATHLGRTDAEFGKILARIEKMSKFDQKVKAARQRALDALPVGADSNLVNEETAAYLVEMHPNLSISQQIIAWLRNAIRAIGKTFLVLERMKWNKWANELTPEDIVFMAKAGMAQAARGEVNTKGETMSRSKAPSQQPITGTATPPAQPPTQSNINLQGRQPGNNASWDSPEPSKLDNIIYALQDKHIDMKRVVAEINEAGGKLIEKFNPYLAEELFHGRAAKRTQDFVNTELKPLIADLRMRGLDIDALDQYLHARHAKEANALIAQRDPEMQDGGSGMTNKEADEYLSSLSADKKARLAAAAKRVDAIIAKTRDMYVSYALVSKDQADGWAQMFEHYVPLMREDNDGGMGVGQGFSIKGKEVKHRTGSTAKVVDILANIALQREKAITRGEKNRVATAMAGLVKLNPNPDFWTFDKVPTERVLMPKKSVYEIHYLGNKHLEFSNLPAAKSFMDYQGGDSSGYSIKKVDIPERVEDRADPMFKSKPNVVIAKIKDTNGQVHERAVIFNESNERAVRMAESFKNLDAEQLGGVMGVSAMITRYFASVNTQYNPIFGVVNIVRDVQGMALNLGSTPIAQHRADVIKLIPSAVKGIFQDARAERQGHTADSKWAALWEELQDEGGMTGYRDLYRNSEDRANSIKSELDPYKWHNNALGKVFTANGALKVPMKIAQNRAGWLFDLLSDYNQTLEGATRLAAYKVARDNGMTKQQAASLAKNITVNFNRKGQIGQQAGAMYAFFNAAMQGTARIAQTMLTMENGKIELTKTGKAIVYGGITLGALQALMLAAAGFDDDEPPEFVRERALIIPIGGKKYLTIPLPLGFHVFPNIGRIPTEWALTGFKNTPERAIHLLGTAIEAFNPLGSAGVSLQTIMPTALDPLTALAENKDWTGKPIYKEDFNSMKPTPGFDRNKDTATAWSKGIAEALNYLSGGTDYVPGAISPTADQIDYLISQVTGGVGREVSKAAQTIETGVTGEELPPHKMPLIGRFYGDSGAQSSQGNAYYSNLKHINEVETEIKGRRENNEPVEDYKKDNPEWKLIGQAKFADKRIKKLREQKRRLVEQDAEREKIKGIEYQITVEMKRLNESVRKLK